MPPQLAAPQYHLSMSQYGQYDKRVENAELNANLWRSYTLHKDKRLEIFAQLKLRSNISNTLTSFPLKRPHGIRY